jgi:hypothetical protein
LVHIFGFFQVVPPLSGVFWICFGYSERLTGVFNSFELYAPPFHVFGLSAVVPCMLDIPEDPDN